MERSSLRMLWLVAAAMFALAAVVGGVFGNMGITALGLAAIAAMFTAIAFIWEGGRQG